MSARHANGRDSICCDSESHNSQRRTGTGRDSFSEHSLGWSKLFFEQTFFEQASFETTVGPSCIGQNITRPICIHPCANDLTNGVEPGASGPASVRGRSIARDAIDTDDAIANEIVATDNIATFDTIETFDTSAALPLVDRALDCVGVSANDRRFNPTLNRLSSPSRALTTRALAPSTSHFAELHSPELPR
jgi:hypothetical protein